MTDRNAEYERLAEQMEAAGLAERYTMDDGREAIRLTPDGKHGARQQAMLTDEQQAELVDGLPAQTNWGRPTEQRGS